MTYENGLWHGFYLSNFYFWKEGEFREMGHLWSLSVEEQFYLIWPTVIIALARFRLPAALVALILSAVVFRFVSEMAGWGLAAYVFPIAALDTLGLGAVLAWSQRTGETWVLRILKPLQIAAVIILPFIGFAPEQVFAILAPLIIGLIGTSLIQLCVGGMTGVVGKVAEFAPLVYLGRISYGLYLYHGLASWIITDTIRESLVSSYTLNLCLVASLKFSILLIIASASWYMFEAPINRYKRLFRMNDQGPAGRRPRRRGESEFTEKIESTVNEERGEQPS